MLFIPLVLLHLLMVLRNTLHRPYVNYILQDSYNCFFNDYNFFLLFLSDTSIYIFNLYTLYPIRLYIRPTVNKPSA